MAKLNENSPLIGVTLSEVEDLQFSSIAGLYASTAAFDEEDYAKLLSFPPSICTSPNKIEATKDSIAQIDGNALTTALLAIGATMEPADVEMTNGTANGNNDNVVEDPLHMLFDATAAQNNNAVMNNETVLVYNTNQRKVSTFLLYERLRNWIINEIPCPNASERIYKLYVHLRSDIMFRSLSEVDDFVHFGYHPKVSVMNLAKLTEVMSAEASTSKRKERELNWEFRCKGKSSDGDFTIYDIYFLKPDFNQDPDNDTWVNQETSEERKGDSGIEHNRNKRRKTLEIVDKEMVETLAHQNRMNKEANKGDENKDDKGNGNMDKGKEKMYEDKGDKNKDKDNNGNGSKDKGKGKMYED